MAFLAKCHWCDHPLLHTQVTKGLRTHTGCWEEPTGLPDNNMCCFLCGQGLCSLLFSNLGELSQFGDN